MSKKHFEALAAELKNARPLPGSSEHFPSAIRAWRNTVEAVTYTCSTFNPNFDRARFLKACGVEV